MQDWWQAWEPRDLQALAEKAAGQIKQRLEAGRKLTSDILANLPETLATQANALSELLRTLASTSAKALPQALETLSRRAETLRVSGVSQLTALSSAAQEALAPRTWAGLVGTGSEGLAWAQRGLQAMLSTALSAIQV